MLPTLVNFRGPPAGQGRGRGGSLGQKHAQHRVPIVWIILGSWIHRVHRLDHSGQLDPSCPWKYAFS